MNRKLGRLLRPGMGMYFFVMAAFCAAALLEEQYWLAAAETSVTLLVFMLYIMSRNRRDKQIQQYIHIKKYLDCESDCYKNMVEEVRKELGLNSLHYQTLPGLMEAIGLDPNDICTYCWNGRE